MLEFDPSADIQALRSTFGEIKAVVDVDALHAEIARLSEEAGAPDLWDDVEKAQKVTSALSHRQAELKRVTEVEQRLDDLDAARHVLAEADRLGLDLPGVTDTLVLEGVASFTTAFDDLLGAIAKKQPAAA